MATDAEILQAALDRLGLALAEKAHTWTAEERVLYEDATRILKSQSTTSADAAEVRQSFELITEEELALLADVTQATLQKWRVEGGGPKYTKLGRKIFYRKSDVQDWIRAGVVT